MEPVAGFKAKLGHQGAVSRNGTEHREKFVAKRTLEAVLWACCCLRIL
jgi:hypothetical protein